MASTCINNIAISPENFLDCPPTKYPSYGWLSSRMSLSREEACKPAAINPSVKIQKAMANVEPEESDPEIFGKDLFDFEFRLEDPVVMLPADELFFDGKLIPLQLSRIRESMTPATIVSSGVLSPDRPKLRQRNEICSTDPCLFSPKAPRCSSRWKELLGLRKLSHNSNVKQEDTKTTSSMSSRRSIKHFLLRGSSKSSVSGSVDSSLNLPLLKEMDYESISQSSRLSLSSSSSSHEYDDLPRLSLDSNFPRTSTRNNLSRIRLANHKAVLSSRNPMAAARLSRSPMKGAPETAVPVRGGSVDSPRMNSSGKIVFHNLERSSSSPSTFNGGPRYKHRAIERSYSANVRVTPVLNVPVCSLRGFQLFSSQQKKENGASVNKNQQNHSKNRKD